MRLCAIIVAAGRGNRMGSPTPKALLPVAGEPMLLHSLRTFIGIPQLASIIVVVAADQVAATQGLLRDCSEVSVPIRIVCGGAERQDSVRAGLDEVDDAVDLVLIHDAARPFISLATVQACIAAAAIHGAAIVAIPAQDTVKIVGADRQIEQTVERTRVWLAQTPQVFRTQWLRDAYARATCDGHLATDDAALVERIGHTVRVVPGDSDNRKLTTAADLPWAEWYAARRARG